MTPSDIHKLADVLSHFYPHEELDGSVPLLHALADVVEAAKKGPCRHDGQSFRGENCDTCEALARVEALPA